jgi:hypothetical protein
VGESFRRPLRLALQIPVHYYASEIYTMDIDTPPNSEREKIKSKRRRYLFRQFWMSKPSKSRNRS